VAWLQAEEPGALPRLRIDTRPARPSQRRMPSPDGRPEAGAALFSGTPEGEQRGSAFAPPDDKS
jgi:hypothetical protein